MANPPTNFGAPLSTGEKIAVGGLGVALLGGIFAALGAKKPAPAKPGLGKPGCGPCGR